VFFPAGFLNTSRSTAGFHFSRDSQPICSGKNDVVIAQFLYYYPLYDGFLFYIFISGLGIFVSDFDMFPDNQTRMKTAM